MHRILFPVITPTVLPRILSQLYALDHEIVLLDNCGIMQRISQKEILAYSFEIFKTVTLVIKDQILNLIQDHLISFARTWFPSLGSKLILKSRDLNRRNPENN